MFENEDEELLSFPEVIRRLQRRVHLSTVVRWTSRGVRNQKLFSVLVGGRRYVPANSLREFLQAINAAPSTPVQNEVPNPSRESQIERTTQELKNEGF
jgi:hypothetical protein